MLPLVAGLGGALLGGLGGALGGGNKGANIGNAMGMDSTQQAFANSAIQNFLGQTGGQAAGGVQGQIQSATDYAQNNPVLGQLFGQNGAMQQAGSQLSDLMKTGYNLTPEDRTAYGQASGDIARQFGAQEQNLAQNLSDRGMNQSGAAGAQFSGLQGNKNEQLAGLQTQLANQRMQTNIQRIGQLQNFMGQMGNQAQGALGQYGNMNQQFLGNLQNAANFGQHQKEDVQAGMEGQAGTNYDTQQQGPLQSGIMGALGGALGGVRAFGSQTSPQQPSPQQPGSRKNIPGMT